MNAPLLVLNLELNIYFRPQPLKCNDIVFNQWCRLCERRSSQPSITNTGIVWMHNSRFSLKCKCGKLLALCAGQLLIETVPSFTVI